MKIRQMLCGVPLAMMMSTQLIAQVTPGPETKFFPMVAQETQVPNASPVVLVQTPSLMLMNAGGMAEPGADTATLLADGKVLITRSASGVLEDHADLYDPVAGMFTRTGNLFGPGANPTATLQNDGRVLIARGSLADSSASTSAAIYDPTTGCGTTSAVRRSTIPLWTNSVLPEV
jgi:hypothetical protein